MRPVYSLIAATVFVALALVGILLIPEGNNLLVVMITLIAGTVPSLVAAAFSERASHDIRNGVLKDKVKEAVTEVNGENGNGVRHH